MTTEVDVINRAIESFWRRYPVDVNHSAEEIADDIAGYYASATWYMVYECILCAHAAYRNSPQAQRPAVEGGDDG